MDRRAHSREPEDFSFRGAFRVTLSQEGHHKLSPRMPLDGWVRGAEDGLVIVQDTAGHEYAYHPDFLEPV